MQLHRKDFQFHASGNQSFTEKHNSVLNVERSDYWFYVDLLNTPFECN